MTWEQIWTIIEKGGMPAVIFALVAVVIYLEKWKIAALETKLSEYRKEKEKCYSERAAILEALRNEFQAKVDEREKYIRELMDKRITDRDNLLKELLEKSKRETEVATKLAFTLERVEDTLTTVKARLDDGQ